MTNDEENLKKMHQMIAGFIPQSSFYQPQSSFYQATPNTHECCPYCYKPFNTEKSKPKQDLLNNEEIELLYKLNKLVSEKKQFLENVRDILS